MKFKFFILHLIVIFLFACESIDDISVQGDYVFEITISLDETASISPDGEYIAYFHRSVEFPEPEEYPSGIYIIKPNGTGKKLIYKGVHFDPSWSPDSKRLVVSTRGVIEIIDTTGNVLHTCILFSDPMFFPSWSSNGLDIVFSTSLGNAGVFITDSIFSTGRKFFETEGLSAIDPNWSPDDSKVIYTKFVSGTDQLFIMNTSTNVETQITNNGKVNQYPAWSENDVISWNINNHLMIMDLATKKQKSITIGRFPCWSPNGEYLIYSGPTEDLTKETLWRIDVDGSNKTQITN